MYRIYSDIQELPIKPELFIVEDSNSGYEFFKAVSDERNLECEREIRKILETPELIIDSKKYFSWERFFTNLLIEKTKNSYLQYRKSAINKTYLHSKNKEKILNCIEAIQW